MSARLIFLISLAPLDQQVGALEELQFPTVVVREIHTRRVVCQHTVGAVQAAIRRAGFLG